MEIVRNSVCRLCLNSNLKLISVFHESEIELSKYIYQVFDIKIKQNDPYSTYICVSCWTLIDALLKRRKEYCKNNAILSKDNHNSKIVQSPMTKAFSNSQNFHPSVQAIFKKYACLHLKVEYWKMNFDAFVDLSICKLNPEIEGFFIQKFKNLQKALNAEKPIKRRRSMSESNYHCTVKPATVDTKQILTMPPGISVRRMSQPNKQIEPHKSPIRKVPARQRKSDDADFHSLSCDEVFGTLKKDTNEIPSRENISNNPSPQSWIDPVTSNKKSGERRKTTLSESSKAILKPAKKRILSTRNLRSHFPDTLNLSNANKNKKTSPPFAKNPKLNQLNNDCDHSCYLSSENQAQDYSSISDVYNKSYIEFDKNIQGLKNTLSSIKNPKKPRRYSNDPSYQCSETSASIMKSFKSQTSNDTINCAADTSSMKRSKRLNKRRVMFGDPVTDKDDGYYTGTIKTFNKYNKQDLSKLGILSPITRMHIQKEMKIIFGQMANKELEKEKMLKKTANVRASIDSITIDENNIKEEITDEVIASPSETIHCPEDTWNNFVTQNYCQVSGDIEVAKADEPEPKLILTNLEQEVFLCHVCDNVFDNKHALNNHFKIHAKFSTVNAPIYSFVDVSPIQLSTKSYKY